MYDRSAASVAMLRQSYGLKAPQRSAGTLTPAPGVAVAAPARSPWAGAFWTVATVASVGASAYHGQRRNDSVGWGIWWGVMGYVAPVITPAIAVAQGFGERKR